MYMLSCEMMTIFSYFLVPGSMFLMAHVHVQLQEHWLHKTNTTENDMERICEGKDA